MLCYSKNVIIVGTTTTSCTTYILVFILMLVFIDWVAFWISSQHIFDVIMYLNVKAVG